jgi:UDP-N-acetyl-D-glucosamine dehydrogenase
MAYKKDVDDQRESPSLRIMHLLKGLGADVSYNDPHVPICRGHRNYPDINMKSRKRTKEILRKADLTLLLTDHSAYDYSFIEKNTKCLIDTRNAFEKQRIENHKIYKA